MHSQLSSNKNAINLIYKPQRYFSLIEEYQNIENLLEKYSESGDTDPQFIETLTKEPTIDNQEFDGLKKLRQTISQLIKLGHTSEAIEKATYYQSQILKHYPEDHPANLSALNNIAIIKKGNNELIEARQILYKVFCGYARVFGVMHISSIVSLQNLGRCYKENDEFDIASKVLMIVIKLRKEQTENIDEVELILCKSHQASCFRELGKYDLAMQWLDDSTADFREIFEDEANLIKGHLLNNRGMVLKRQEKFLESETCYQECLKIREENMEKGHPEVLAIKHNLGIYFGFIKNS